MTGSLHPPLIWEACIEEEAADTSHELAVELLKDK